MTILFSRQDLYDYCRSVFIHHHIDMVPETLAVNSEVILVQPQGYFGGVQLQSVSLTDWVNAKEIGFAQFYRLYHLTITSVVVEEGITRYGAKPVSDTLEQFPSSPGLFFHITGYFNPEDNRVVWDAIDGGLSEMYSLETVINALNRVNTPLNRNQVAHMTGDIRERLYHMVNDSFPSPHFQRDAFRHHFLWRIGHCAAFYGIPFLLCLAIPWTECIVFAVAAADCYFSHKAMKKFTRTATLSLYRAIKQWRGMDAKPRYSVMDYERWKMQTSNTLCNLKTLPLGFLSKRQQALYMTQLDDLLEQVNQIDATEESIAPVSLKVQQVFLTFSILPHYH